MEKTQIEDLAHKLWSKDAISAPPPHPNFFLHNYLKAELSPCHALEKNEVTDCLNSIITSQMIPVSFSEALFFVADDSPLGAVHVTQLELLYSQSSAGSS